MTKETPPQFVFIRNLREKKPIELPDWDKYSAHLTNKAMSLDLDAVLHSNEMNRYPDLPPEAQYQYYLNVIRGRKGHYGKWPKPEADPPEIDNLCAVYHCSRRIARQMAKSLTNEQILHFRNLSKGGQID